MKQKLLFLIFSYFSFFSFSLFAQHGRLQVSANGHYLQYEDGTPFFWLGDTGLDLFRRLKLEEADQYLTNRGNKGFTVIHASILSPHDSLHKPNQYGVLPFRDQDPDKPNEKYFQTIDAVIKLAGKKGLFMALLPAWGDKVCPGTGSGQVVFDSANAYRYGLWLGKRYASYPNIIWVLGGGCASFTGSAVWRQMARGIRKGTADKAFITYHPPAGHSSSEHFHNESWLNMNMVHSGHTSRDTTVWEWITKDFNRTPAKPTLDAEPNHEDRPVNSKPGWDTASGYFRAVNVRRQAYRSVFAGAAGVTYGHHAVWQFYSPREEKIDYAEQYWTAALDSPGAFQVGYLRSLIESRPFHNRIPDQTLVTGGQGEMQYFITAFRDEKNTYAMIYLPFGLNIPIHTSFLKSDSVVVWWFNPKDGQVKRIGPKQRSYIMSFTPPVLGPGNDWVLILDHPKSNYGEPGKSRKSVRSPKSEVGGPKN